MVCGGMAFDVRKVFLGQRRHWVADTWGGGHEQKLKGYLSGLEVDFLGPEGPMAIL